MGYVKFWFITFQNLKFTLLDIVDSKKDEQDSIQPTIHPLILPTNLLVNFLGSLWQMLRELLVRYVGCFVHLNRTSIHKEGYHSPLQSCFNCANGLLFCVHCLFLREMRLMVWYRVECLICLKLSDFRANPLGFHYCLVWEMLRYNGISNAGVCIV